MTVYIFNSDSKKTDWSILNDMVMGGKSDGHFTINKAGYGLFSGVISLENNGGFSSVRHNCQLKSIANFTGFKIRLKGDGKTYQFRVKANKNHRLSYAARFESTGNWETITVPFSNMLAVFRGRNLDMPHFQGETIEEIGFLIGTKKPEDFKLEIESIVLVN